MLDPKLLSESDHRSIQRAHDWAVQYVAERAETWEAERRFASEAFKSAGEHRLTGLLVPTADLGEELSLTGLARTLEEIASVDFAVAFTLVCHNNLAGAVARNAGEQLRSNFLPGLVD